jgi:hypothetical protein
LNGTPLNVGAHLTINSGLLELTNMLLNVGGNLMLNAGRLSVWTPPTNIAAISVAGSMTVTNGGLAHVYAAPTNVTVGYGARVTVSGDVVVATGSWIYPHSSPTNGGSVWFQAQNLTTLSGGGFNADGLGFGGTITANGEYVQAFGPGGGIRIGEQSGGGGYGGLGGGASPRGGAIYGVTNAPLLPGSGGGGGWSTVGGSGGGLIYVDVSGIATINGTFSANGNGVTSGGSGGAIYLKCRRLAGSTGVLQAIGGAGMNSTYGAGGGGGRIAVYSASSVATINSWTISVVGGGYPAQGTTGQTGSVFWGNTYSGTLIIIR